MTNNVTADNPSTHGGGYRVFPEKATPGGANLNTVKARITLNAKAPVNQTVYYQIFDMDDPTANGTNNVVDPTDTATAFLGADNRLSAGGTGLGITPAGANTATVTAGTNIVDVTFTVTDPQPGNNWKLVAHTESAYVSAVNINSNSTVKGLDFLQGGSNSVPASFKSSLLSVWRTLHVEMDSMAAPGTNNFTTGNLVAIYGTLTNATQVFVDQDLGDGSPNLTGATGNGRFESGLLTIGIGAGSPGATPTAALDGNGTNFIQKTSGNGINLPFLLTKSGMSNVTGNVTVSSDMVNFTLNVTNGTLSAAYTNGMLNVAGVQTQIVDVLLTTVTTAGKLLVPFTVHDDDDDTLVNATRFPDASLLTNALFIAYISPKFDLVNPTAVVPFVASIASDSIAITNAQRWDSRALNANDYWVAYVCSGFQGGTLDDHDPSSETEVTLGTTAQPFGGSFVFFESFSYHEIHPFIPTIDTNFVERLTVVHEVGHALAERVRPPTAPLHPVANQDGAFSGTIVTYDPKYVDYVRTSERPRE